jgi:hypothetical protein
VTPEFGDTVRIRDTELTRKLGIAGQSGSVYGETTPSVSGIEVAGGACNDHALSVMLAERGEQLWLAADLVEFVDHAPGTEEALGGRRFVRAATGDWEEKRSGQPSLRRGFIHWLFRSVRGR